VLTSNVAVFAVLAVCCLPGACQPGQTHFTVCAVDRINGRSAQSDSSAGQVGNCEVKLGTSGTTYKPAFGLQTVTGDFRALTESQVVVVRATDTDGRSPLANADIQLIIAGANAAHPTIHTDKDGFASYTYSGTHTGTDTITAATSGSSSAASHTSSDAVIHWRHASTIVHPIIFLHGFSEDANVIESQQEWTAEFEALDMTYDPAFIETFCYTDDKAYSDSSHPARCPAPLTPGGAPASPPDCSSQSCRSDGSIDVDAIELARRILDLHARVKGLGPSGSTPKITLMGYSMGTAISRTMLAGCLNTSTTLPADSLLCKQASASVDQAFFLNGVQQGSWLMVVKTTLDGSRVSGNGIPGGSASSFVSVWPLLAQSVFSAVDQVAPLRPDSLAARDMTPQSGNILAHNSVDPPATVQYYTFYGNIQLQLGVTIFVYQLPGKVSAPLGDLVLLAQDEHAKTTPLWGGAALCDSCDPASASTSYAASGNYHGWALGDPQRLDMSAFSGVLAAPTAASNIAALRGLWNSPVQHLGIAQPRAQAPGSALTVHDATGTLGGGAVDMPSEILAMLLMNGETPDTNP
jgi:hypothetical protein